MKKKEFTIDKGKCRCNKLSFTRCDICGRYLCEACGDTVISSGGSIIDFKFFRLRCPEHREEEQ